MTEQQFSLQLHLQRNYQFTVTFDDSVPELLLDEPPPLGDGVGPSASRLLAAAVGNCLAASLALCLRKARIELTNLCVNVTGTLARNASGRWRIGSIDVRLAPNLSGPQGRIDRCLDVFEDFCIVTQSVRQGIEVNVTVEPPMRPESLAPPSSVDRAVQLADDA